MSLYRCSACGSPNVVTSSENAGFSYSKGIAGAIVFGAPGAVAGINGKTKQVFKCPDCGLTMDSPMANEIKIMIDLGLMSENARNNLTLNGVKIDWTTLTGRYKNIEKSYVDDEIAKKKEKKEISVANDKRILEEKATSTKEEFDKAIETLFKIKAKDGYFKKEDRIYSKQHPIEKEEFETGVKAIFIIIENFYKFLPPQSYKPGVMYNNQNIYMGDIFNEYVILRYYSLTAMSFFHTKSTIEYMLDSDPFISAFVRQYCKEGSICDTNLNGWLVTSGKVHSSYYFGMNFMNFLVRCELKECGDALGRYKTLFGFDLNEIWLPRFAIIDDKLCYWDKSFKDSQSGLKLKIDDLINSYFKYNKDKKSDFNDFLKCTDTLFDRYESIVSEMDSIPKNRKDSEKRIKDIKNRNTNINNQVSENDYQIEKLSRKIFFKTKANEQISELRKTNDDLNKEKRKNNETIKVLKQKIEDGKEAYSALMRIRDKLKQELLNETLQQLFIKMNNFIDWTATK